MAKSRFGIGLFTTSFLLLTLVWSPAGAATLTVTNLSDSGAGSLRGQIAAAAANDTIVFAPGLSGTIALASTIALTQNVSIQGPGAAIITLDGQALTFRIFDVPAGVTLGLSGVTLTRGNTTGLGGAIQVGGTLNANNCVFTANNASNGGAIAVVAGGTATIDSCTFSQNTATSVGGGAIIAFGSVTLTRSTLVGNTAPINGGAINTQPSGTTTIVNSTFFENTSGSLGGALSNLGTTSVTNSTFSANQGSDGAVLATANSNVTFNNNIVTNHTTGALSPSGTFTDASNNVFFNNLDDQDGYGTQNPVIATSDPIGPLANNGGPTQTMMPVFGGAAICAGSVDLVPPGTTTDQRGFGRFTGNCVDAGAVQHNTTPVPTLSTWAMILMAALLAFFGMRHLRQVGGGQPLGT